MVFNSGFGAHQQTFCANFRVGFGKGGDRGPHGNHELGAHLFQFGHHRFGIGVFAWVKAPLPHGWPVDEVGHDDREGKASAVVFAGDFHEFVLAGVTQFGLPQAQCPLGNSGRVAHRVGIGLEDFLGSVSYAHPVVDPFACLRDPACGFFGEFHAANAGVVPQESIALV